MALFEYGKSTKDYRYYFQLRDDNGLIILSSARGYPDEAGCLKEIDWVKTNAREADRYRTTTGYDQLHYFELGPTGKSEGYNASFNRDRGIEHCMMQAPGAGIRKIVPFSRFKLTDF